MQKDTVLEAGDPQMLFENVLKSIRDAGYQLEDVAYDYFALDHETMAEEFMLLDKTGETVSTEGISWEWRMTAIFIQQSSFRKGFPYTLAVRIFRKTKRESADPRAVFRERNRETGCLAAIFLF